VLGQVVHVLIRQLDALHAWLHACVELAAIRCCAGRTDMGTSQSVTGCLNLQTSVLAHCCAAQAMYITTKAFMMSRLCCCW
jgi:hypothetical protein